MSAETILKLVKAGVITTNEARTLLGLSRLMPPKDLYLTKADAGPAIS